MKAFIVGSGNIVEYDRFFEYSRMSDFLICCDGGMKHFFECGLVPDVIIGDMDSAEPKYVEHFLKLGVKFEKFPIEKDFTDMELGVLFAVEKKVSEIFIFGGIGSRFDHTLTNAHILKKALDNGILAWLIDEKNKICLIDKKTAFFGAKGDLISLIPFTTKVFGVTTKGLYYPLENAVMEIGNSLGVSNVMLSDECEISLDDGILFVVMARD